eukprot:775984_1
MLCGMVQPTSGNAFIGDLSLTDNLDEIRRHLGFCPQHDILFPSWTVTEHLLLYGRIKGILEDQLPVVVNQLLKDVDLEVKAGALVHTLSGGQKRKLSVAIALMGDSKVVFLDEPTAGMDPHARRSTWDLIKKKKK